MPPATDLSPGWKREVTSPNEPWGGYLHSGAGSCNRTQYVDHEVAAGVVVVVVVVVVVGEPRTQWQPFQ